MKNVIDFKIKEREWNDCQHLTLEVDIDNKTIFCKDCKNYIDAFVLFEQRARKQEDLEYRHNILIEKYNALNSEFKRKCKHCGQFNTYYK